jgi:hypothetical protein
MDVDDIGLRDRGVEGARERPARREQLRKALREDMALDAIVSLPELIGGVFLDMAGLVIDTLSGWAGDALQFFLDLPGRALSAIASLVADIGRVFIDMAAGVVTTLAGWVLSAIEFYVTFPFKAATAIAGLVPEVLAVVTDMATSAITGIVGFITDAVAELIQLPGKAVSALASLASSVAGVVSDMASTALANAVDFVIDVVAEVKSLPGKAVDALSSLGADLAGAVTTAAGRATTAASTLVSDVVAFFTGLPGKILDALGSIGSTIASGLRSAFKTAWNGLVGLLKVTIPIPFAPDVTVDIGRYLKLANGAILNRPTFAQVGEAGPEAVIPISRPGRAMQLMEQSGLGAMWDEANGAGGGRGGPLVSIGSAAFYNGTDADLVLQRGMAALRSKKLVAA